MKTLSRSLTQALQVAIGICMFTPRCANSVENYSCYSLFLAHYQGWVYFYNSALRVVTDHDIREPGMIDCIVAYCAKTELPQLPEGLEFHLHLPMQGNDGAVSFNLIINHSLCLASYNPEDVMEERRCSSDPQKCMVH